MLQIDHVYEFLYENLFKDFEFFHCLNGVVHTGPIDISDVSIFTPTLNADKKIFFYDQEPLIPALSDAYIELFAKNLGTRILVTSEWSSAVDNYAKEFALLRLYYFFHGFAAQDWYRGYYALNYNKDVFKDYKHDYISFNRIITNDRSYRIYFVSKLVEQGLLDRGQVSFNVTDNQFDDWRDEVTDPNTKLSEHARQHAERHLTDIDRLVIDHAELPGSASANIPRTIARIDFNNDTLNVDAFWHIVTETVFYYPKLHLTEKIFKPIVSKQPFMLLAAPGNLKYLQDYGFMTFGSVIDESYDTIEDNDLRIDAVITQLSAYCALPPRDKLDFIRAIEPIIEHNFHHFYGEFRHIITRELLDNTKTLFKDIGYDDGHINYNDIYHVLTH